jgi:acetyltransferase-like isoleucine patch superfamily enzyme
MHFGADVYLGPGARITAHDGFFMGDHSGAGPGLWVIGGNRNIGVVGADMLSITDGGENLPVVVERDVYMGGRVTLLKGVTVGEGSVVGACSVVTKDVPRFAIAAGTPCAVLRSRFNLRDLESHLARSPSGLTLDEVIETWERAGLRYGG